MIPTLKDDLYMVGQPGNLNLINLKWGKLGGINKQNDQTKNIWEQKSKNQNGGTAYLLQNLLKFIAKKNPQNSTFFHSSHFSTAQILSLS